MNDFDIGYYAGFFDGEGSFDISILRPTPNNRRKNTFYAYRGTLVNTYLPIIQEFQKHFGGSISKKKAHPNRKTCYAWVLNGKNLVNFINTIIPHLREKKERAQIILDYASTVSHARWSITPEKRKFRDELYARLKLLNKIGPKN